MSAKQETFDVPDKEPWKDAEVLDDLYNGEGLDQPEIADRLDTTASTISYWMNKLEVDTTHTKHSGTNDEDALTEECWYHEVCGNYTATERNALCTECLDLTRYRERDGHDCLLDQEGIETIIDHMEKLYEIYNE